MRRAIIVAPWGSPFEWRLAYYTIDGVQMVESKTVLEALSRLYRDSLIGGLIIVLDTLITAGSKECGIEPSEPNAVGKYTELLNRVRDKVQEWILKCSNAEFLKSHLRQFEIAVLPGVGHFGGWKFGVMHNSSQGVLPSFYAEAFLHVLKCLCRYKPDTIVLDLSHGINYMPSFVLKATLEAAMAYSAANGIDVKVEVYNGEPYPRVKGEAPPPLLFVHKVFSIEIDPKNAAVKIAVELDEWYRREKSHRNPWVYEKGKEAVLGPRLSGVKGKLKKILDYGVIATRIALYSMPLAAIYLAKDVIEDLNEDPLTTFLNVIDEVLDVHRNNVEIDVNTHEVRHPLALTPYPLIYYAYAAALTSFVIGCVGKYVDLNTWRREDGIDVGVLREITDEFPRHYNAVAQNELHTIEEKMAKGEEIPIVIGEGDWPNAECKASSLDKRHLKAHAGLEKNITEGKRVGGRIWLRYRRVNGDCWVELRGQLLKPDF